MSVTVNVDNTVVINLHNALYVPLQITFRISQPISFYRYTTKFSKCSTGRLLFLTNIQKFWIVSKTNCLKIPDYSVLAVIPAYSCWQLNVHTHIKRKVIQPLQDLRFARLFRAAWKTYGIEITLPTMSTRSHLWRIPTLPNVFVHLPESSM